MEDNERNRIKTFDCFTDQNNLGRRWKRWLTAFELLADGKGLIIDEEHTTNKQRRRALLLHMAGTDVQDIFATLPETGDFKDYKKAIDALNTYFVPKVDTTYARHSFRKLIQTPGETVRQFATRLRCAAEGQGLTLTRSHEIAENGEKVDSQLAAMTLDGKGDGAMSNSWSGYCH